MVALNETAGRYVRGRRSRRRQRGRRGNNQHRARGVRSGRDAHDSDDQQHKRAAERHRRHRNFGCNAAKAQPSTAAVVTGKRLLFFVFFVHAACRWLHQFLPPLGLSLRKTGARASALPALGKIKAVGRTNARRAAMSGAPDDDSGAMPGGGGAGRRLPTSPSFAVERPQAKP